MKRLLLLVLSFTIYNAIALAQQNTSADSIIKAFKQGPAGNCASISVIKLAIAQYGLHGVFLKVDTLSDKFNIQLRDGNNVVLTKAELATMAGYDKFMKLHDEAIFSAAKFMYAVMAKRKQDLHPGTYSAIQDAASYKNFFRKTIYLLAQNTEDNLAYLGVNHTSALVKITDAATYQNIIITNPKHSAYSSKGYYDEFGEATSNARFPSLHGGKPMNKDYNYILTAK